MKDPCIRQLLKDTQLAHFFNDGNSRIVEELNLPVAKARIDIAVINGFLHGYEIKSASDTLQRLPGQIEAYTKVFDYLSIVTENKYHERIIDFVPPWIGILVCYEENGFKFIEEIRKPEPNTKKESFFIAKLLWRDELIQTLVDHKITFRKKDRNWLLCETLSNSLDLDTISSIIRQTLKGRSVWKTVLQQTM